MELSKLKEDVRVSIVNSPVIQFPLYYKLNHFRKQIFANRSALHFHPYTIYKTRANLYRIIFAVLGLLFLALDGCLFLYIKGWAGSLLFSSYVGIRMSLYTLCSFLSFLAFTAALLIKDHDIVHHLAKKTKRKLARIFKCTDEHTAVQLAYSHALEKIEHLQEDTLHILERIGLSKTITEEEKGRLCDEAVLELTDKLGKELQLFRAQASFSNLHFRSP